MSKSEEVVFPDDATPMSGGRGESVNAAATASTAGSIGRKQIQEAEKWASFYKEALDEAAIVAVTDSRGTILSVNSKFCRLSGYNEAELIGANHRLLRSGFHNRDFFRDLYGTISSGHVWHGEICNKSKTGQLYWVDTTIVPHKAADGRIESYTAIRFDITPQKMAEDRLWHLANIDSMTGLPNRRRFMEDLHKAIESDNHHQIVVGIMDVDHFKDINDSLGHAAGDELLQEFAIRMRAAMSPQDIIARLGGDEFAFLFRNCSSRTDKEARLSRIYETLEVPMVLCGGQQKLAASIGVARVTHDDTSGGDLLKHADIALYAAKALGRNRAEFFSEEMHVRVVRRTDLLKRFERGLEAGEFRVHYQPIVPLRSMAPVKVEALLRWEHPDDGLLYPGDFFDALSDEGLSSLADAYVLEVVLRDIQTWKRAGISLGSVAINATLGDFRNSHYVDRILSALKSGEIKDGDLCVEITEGMLIGSRGSQAINCIEKLHNNGVRIAFDDFGTGYASLKHLRETPVDIIKIDKSFVNSITSDKKDRSVVECTIKLAHDLGKIVIAEGVETKDQAKILKSLACDYVQGFLVSTAMNFNEFNQRIKSGDIYSII